MPDPEIDRLKKEYARRFDQEIDKNLYTVNDPAYSYYVHRFSETLFALLKNSQIQFIENCTILEIGCGTGGVFSQLVSHGVPESSLIGLDIIFNSLCFAKNRFPFLKLINADAQSIPFPCKSFEILLQFTAFSSILQDRIKEKMAKEMLRVIRDDGVIIWYDFWWNPTNKQTKGIRPAEIRTLFPGCTFKFWRITLAPPIARKVVPISLSLAQAMESFRILNSHYLVLIRKNDS